jgi:hypothetical protein
MKSATASRFELGHPDLEVGHSGKDGKRSTAGGCSALCSQRMASGGAGPAEGVSMRRVGENLDLKHAGPSVRAIARSPSLAHSTVAVTLERAAAAACAGPCRRRRWATA